MELSGRYIQGGQSNANGTISNTGMMHDWGQGHGLIDTKYAIQMALTLESLRNADEDGDGHSRKYATLTSLAAALATEKFRVNANKIPRTVLIIFFIVLPICGLLINKI